MGVEIKTKQINLSEFFRLKSSSVPADLIDLTYIPSNVPVTAKNFLNSPGDAVYRVHYFVRSMHAYNLGVVSINFDFFSSYPKPDSIPIPNASFVELINSPKNGKQATVGDYTVPYDNSYFVHVSTESPEFAGFSNSKSKSQISKTRQVEPSLSFRAQTKIAENNLSSDPAKSLNAGYYLSSPPSRLGFASSKGGRHTTDAEKPRNYFDKGGQKNSRVSLRGKREETAALFKGSQVSPEVVGFVAQKGLNHEQSISNLIGIKIISQNTEYMRDFHLNKQHLAGLGKIYMKVSAKFEKGKNLLSTESVYVIDHLTEVMDFIGTPAAPTFVVTENSATKISVVFKKTDPLLRRILVTRIVKNPYFANSSVEKRGVVDFGNSDTAIFSDNSPNIYPNIIIYRFIVENLDGSFGEFQSFLPKTFKMPLMPDLSYSVSTPISIRALNSKSEVKVSVHILTNEVSTLRLMREDLSATGEFKKRVVTIPSVKNEFYVDVKNQKAVLEFVDTSALIGRSYRYFAMYRLGEKSYSKQEVASDEDEIFIKRPTAQKIPFNPTFAFLNLSGNTNNNVTVDFDLQIKENQDDYAFFLEALRVAKVDSQFAQDFASNKQKLKEIAGFLVERIDRSTSRREIFGLYPPGKFSDSPEERAKKGISEFIPGNKYEYVFKFCVRPAPSFINDAYYKIVSQKDQPGNSISKLAVKYLNAAFISQGVLPAETALREDTSIVDNMKSGQTGIELVSDIVTIPNLSPVILIDQPIVKGNYALISWKVLGNVSNVSYFIVYCQYEEKKNILGTVACVGESSTYKFRDDKYANAVGKSIYSIEIMTIDHDSTLESPGVVVVNNNSSPVSVIGGYVIPPDANSYTKIVTVDQGPGNTINSTTSPAGEPSSPNFADKKLSEKYSVGGIGLGIVQKSSIFPNSLVPDAISPIALGSGAASMLGTKVFQAGPSNPLPPKPKSIEQSQQFLGIAESSKILSNNNVSKIIDLVKNLKSQDVASNPREPLSISKFSKGI